MRRREIPKIKKKNIDYNDTEFISAAYLITIINKPNFKFRILPFQVLIHNLIIQKFNE